MIRFYPSVTEIEICRHIGAIRHRETSKQGTERKQDDKQDSLEISFIGVVSEYAVAKYLNLNFDLNCDFRKFGADLISKKGAKIDVKCAKTSDGNLNAVAWSGSKDADIYILTVLGNNYIGIVGWVSRDNFIIDDNLKQGKNGEYYSLPQSALIPFNEQRPKTTL